MKNENDCNADVQNVAHEKRECVSERHRISSQELFGSHNEIFIDHHNDEYRLRITSNDKLILTK